MNKRPKTDGFALLVGICISFSCLASVAWMHLKRTLIQNRVEQRVLSPWALAQPEVSMLSLNELLLAGQEPRSNILGEIAKRIGQCNDMMSLPAILDTLKIQKVLYNWTSSNQSFIRKDYYGIGHEYMLEITRIADDGRIFNIGILGGSSEQVHTEVLRATPARIQPEDINSELHVVTRPEAATIKLQVAIMCESFIVAHRPFYLSYQADFESAVDTRSQARQLWVNRTWGSTLGSQGHQFLDCEFLGPMESGFTFRFSLSQDLDGKFKVDIPSRKVRLKYPSDRTVNFGHGVTMYVDWQLLK